MRVKSITFTSFFALLLLFPVIMHANPKQADGTNIFQINSITVNGHDLKYNSEKEINIGASPYNIVFQFSVAQNAPHRPLRIQSKLEGVDTNWNVGGGEMVVDVLFSDESGDAVSRKIFMVQGDSSGWKGNLVDSTFTHRREVLTVPPKATRVQLIISSAGPQTTTGIYVVDNFVISRLSKSTGKFQVLLHSPSFDSANGKPPTGWSPEGDHPSMATVVDIGSDPKTKALAIIDEDPAGHADWHYREEFAPKVTPNEQIVVEWNEIFSIGESGTPSIEYRTLLSGTFKFRVAEANILGHLTGNETDVIIRVPLALWKKPSFWIFTAILTVTIIIGGLRYVAKQKLKNAMFKLEQQRSLERERLRIARDIHDDLGARVTQISLLSAMAESETQFPDTARTKFDQISTLSRELVSALYETVWAVNPENDNLEAMVNYFSERINELCDQAGLKCRLHISNIPKNFEVSSRARHNINMIAKEAMNNIIKYAHASQVTVTVSCSEDILSMSIQDNGRGFDLEKTAQGNGLPNMTDRMQELGGTISIHSAPETGTTIKLQLNIKSVQNNSLNAKPQTED